MLTPLNRPITSREYKLMLNPVLFGDRQQGMAAFREMIDLLAKKNKAHVDRQDIDKKKHVLRRLTSYLDTPGGDLHRNHFTLRQRKEKDGKDKLTLKYRAGDRYQAARSQVSCDADWDCKKLCKFEEDITPPFVSKFSHSCSVEQNQLPKIKNLRKAVKVFPGLDRLDLPGGTPVMNRFKARETAYRIGKLTVRGEKKTCVKLCMTFWQYPGQQQGYPLTVEFSFDFDADKKDQDKNLEGFPAKVVKQCNRFFTDLSQQAVWMQVGGTTKTAFAYGL